jgi:N12 class adenine-specific DNA methylase
LRLVRRGGLVAVITSYGTLDKRDSRVRQWLARRAVMPAPLTPGQITVTFGAPWVPADIVEAFICALIPSFQSASTKGQVVYRRPLAKWTVSDETYSRRSHAATVAWGTGHMHALEIIEKGLNHQIPVVYATLPDGSRVVNQRETLLAREQLARIKERWATWVWEDPDRTTRLCAIYNEQFNAARRRDFDGSHLTLPGIHTAILRDGDLARHQAGAGLSVGRSAHCFPRAGAGQDDRAALHVCAGLRHRPGGVRQH